MPDKIDNVEQLLENAANGDQQSWTILLDSYRERLRKMVALRMDGRLQSRVDASDVVQESCLEAWERLDEYRRDPKAPFFLWLRFLTGQKLITLYRHHVGTQMRDADREVSIDRGRMPEASSAMLAAQLLGHDPRPSELAVQKEIKTQLQDALNKMDPLDREVLALRHFEQLSRAETAQVLGLQESATSKRYVRALKKLKDILARIPDGFDDMFQ